MAKMFPKVVGIIGYSAPKFDEEKAKKIIKDCFDNLEKKYGEVAIASGLTDLGISALAYREAKKRGWKTIGIACEKAKEHKLFDCDEVIIVGKEWGDESETFLNKIDCIVKIGGGKQSEKEFAQAKDMEMETYEFELAVI